MLKSPRALRVHIGLFGRRNVGKSSLLNAIARQEVAIVSASPGTTTDPVEKSMEMLPLGPVVFIDTAGMDDAGELGEMRVRRSRKVIDRIDVALVVTTAGVWGAFETELLQELDRAGVPAVVVFNKCDQAPPSPPLCAELRRRGRETVLTIASRGEGADVVRQALIDILPAQVLESPSILGDLVPVGGCVVLVTPIDLEAPRGRLIMPQVQTLRDALDNGLWSLVTRESELPAALAGLRSPPDLVVTDSQAFAEVAAVVPPGVPLTSFSILFARLKGDLAAFVRGAEAIGRLRDGDRVLVAEACTHHPIGGDIGREKIPQWLAECTGARLAFDTVAGRDFPDDLSPFALVIHCGACTFNRPQMQSRLQQCARAGVPITNYGVAIAWAKGIFPRALAPFGVPVRP